MAARKRRPPPRWQERMARAATPEDRLAAASDRLTSSLAHLRRKRRDAGAHARGCAVATRLAGEAAEYLIGLAERAEGSDSA
jgi:hypothetical protein